MPLSPEEVDRYFINHQNLYIPHHGLYGHHPSISLSDFSPSIPKDFDFNMMPRQLCQKQLLQLLKCKAGYKDHLQKYCQASQQEFIRCKMNRDARISKQVLLWESNHFTALEKDMRSFYMRGLGFKLARLESQHETSGSGSDEQSMLAREIQQLKKRISNLQRLKL